eukprot:941242-Rhodomonas_salina.1
MPGQQNICSGLFGVILTASWSHDKSWIPARPNHQVFDAKTCIRAWRCRAKGLQNVILPFVAVSTR